MIVIARIFQIIVLLFIFYGYLSDKKKEPDEWKKLTIAKWVFNFCGIASWVLSFGVIALLEEIDVHDINQVGICVIFSMACVVCMYIMFLQKIWCVKYNDEELIFRNSIGIIKTYHIDELRIIDGNRVNRICHNGKTIIKWDGVIMNFREEIEIYKHFETIKKKYR